MPATSQSQSLSEFRERSTKTIERINRTGDPEFLTVDGEPRAVLLAPETYAALMKEAFLAHDVGAIRQSMRELAAGQGQKASPFFAELRSKLQKMKSEQDQK